MPYILALSNPQDRKPRYVRIPCVSFSNHLAIQPQHSEVFKCYVWLCPLILGILFLTVDKYLDTKWCIYCLVGHFSPFLMIEIGLWSIWPYLNYIYQNNLEHRPTVLKKAFMFWKTSLFRGFDTYSPVLIIFQSMTISQGYISMIC